MDEKTFQQKKMEFKNCSFCGIPREHVFTVIIGKDACICPNCVLGSHKRLVQERGNQLPVHNKEDSGIHQSLKNGVIVIIVLIIMLLLVFFLL
jgi:hypothetical protein